MFQPGFQLFGPSAFSLQILHGHFVPATQVFQLLGQIVATSGRRSGCGLLKLLFQFPTTLFPAGVFLLQLLELLVVEQELLLGLGQSGFGLPELFRQGGVGWGCVLRLRLACRFAQSTAEVPQPPGEPGPLLGQALLLLFKLALQPVQFFLPGGRFLLELPKRLKQVFQFRGKRFFQCGQSALVLAAVFLQCPARLLQLGKEVFGSGRSLGRKTRNRRIAHRRGCILPR